MTDEINKPMYGVWIPGKGWVKSGRANAVFADHNKEIAEQLAKRLRQGATVYFVDAALSDMEDQLLQAEQLPLFKWMKGKHAVSK